MIMSIQLAYDLDRVQILGVEVAEPPFVFIMLRSFGFWVSAFGFLGSGSGFRVWGLEVFRMWTLAFRVYILVLWA